MLMTEQVHERETDTKQNRFTRKNSLVLKNFNVSSAFTLTAFVKNLKRFYQNFYRVDNFFNRLDVRANPTVVPSGAS